MNVKRLTEVLEKWSQHKLQGTLWETSALTRRGQKLPGGLRVGRLQTESRLRKLMQHMH